MICILKIRNGEIVGWTFGTDLHDARRQVPGEAALVNELYVMEFARPGKHKLISRPSDGGEYVMLVS